MSLLSWLLIGAGIAVVGLFGFKLAKRWRDEGRDPHIEPPYYT